MRYCLDLTNRGHGEDLISYLRVNNIQLISDCNLESPNYVTSALIHLEPLTEERLILYPNLEYILSPTTGLNHIATSAIARYKVLSLRDVDISVLSEIQSTTELTLLLVLTASRGLLSYVNSEVCPTVARSTYQYCSLSAQSVGILGLGRIGLKVAEILSSLGADVSYYDPYVKSRFQRVGLRHLFRTSNILVICCKLTEETYGMVDLELLTLMQSNALIVNTARSEVVRIDQLLDVLRNEPHKQYYADCLPPLLESDALRYELFMSNRPSNFILTPHIGGACIDSVVRAERLLFEKYISLL